MRRFVMIASLLCVVLLPDRNQAQTSSKQAPKAEVGQSEAANDSQTKQPAPFFYKQRLKALTLPDSAIVGNSTNRVVDGIWMAESKDPGKALALPLQVKIQCHNYGADDRGCTEIAVAFLPVEMGVMVQEIDTQDYDIDSWDAHGLIASYGGTEIDSRCQRHVLTMDFRSGAVSAADIPTHKKGCEIFKETNSYRLVSGIYYVDTSPNNDWDKPVKPEEKR